MDESLLRGEKGVRALFGEVERALDRIGRPIKLMEVCGTHTMTAYRSGLGHALRKRGLHLISGPGCPVCITPDSVVSSVARLVKETPDMIVASFGDMLRVPTSHGSLLTVVPARGSAIKIVYSPAEVVAIAAADPGKKVVFLAVGFETTIPSIAWVVGEAEKRRLGNLYLVTCMRLVPPPLKAMLADGDTRLDGFIYPGHVSVIIGAEPYEFIPREYGMPGAITGFEPADLLMGIVSVLKQIETKHPVVDIAYKRAVRPEGNPLARRLMDEAFFTADSEWRGFGTIPLSGLKVRNARMDAEHELHLRYTSVREHPGCRCGDVVKGLIEPEACPLFKKACTPDTPIGPCMVSVEGACLIHYKYGGVSWIE